MRNSIRKVLLVAGIAVAGFAMTMGTASADPGDLSEYSQRAWDNWDEGGAQVGSGAARMISGAYVGSWSIPADYASGKPVPSEYSQRAWDNWDEGGKDLGNGAARMVSGAYVGTWSIPADYAGGLGMTESDVEVGD